MGRIPIKMTLNIVKTEFQVKRLTFATEQAPHMKQTDDQEKNYLFLYVVISDPRHTECSNLTEAR